MQPLVCKGYDVKLHIISIASDHTSKIPQEILLCVVHLESQSNWTLFINVWNSENMKEAEYHLV